MYVRVLVSTTVCSIISTCGVFACIFPLDFRKRQFSCGTDLWSISVDIGFGIQLRKIQAFFLVKSVKFRCKIVFSAFESWSKRRLRQPSNGSVVSAGRRDSWHRRQSKILEKHLVMPRYIQGIQGGRSWGSYLRLLILFLPGASLPRCLSRAASFAYPMLFPLTSSDRRTVVAPFQPSRNSNLAGT